MKKLLIIATIIGLLGTVACKKSSTNSSTSGGNIDISGKTKQQVFMMQKWKIGSWSDSNTNIGLQDALANCDKDDSYNFNSTSSFVLDRGTCTNGDPQTENMPWSMTSANASDVTIFGATYNIEGQTSTSITLTRTYILQGYNTKQVVVFGKF